MHCAFWSSQDIRGLSEDGRTLALYLLTSPHTTLTGTFRLPDGYVSEDLQWSTERVSEGFAELFAKGFANRCETTKWVWILKFLDWNAPENPNQWKAARKIVSQIPDQCSWKADFKRLFAKSCGDPEEPLQNPSETVSKSGSGSGTGFTTASETPVRTARVSRKQKSTEADPPWFAEFKQAYPPRDGEQNWRKAMKAARARIAEGHSPEEFISGAKRYAEHCEANGKLRSQFVKQAATFLGPDKSFLEPWVTARFQPEQRGQDMPAVPANVWGH